MNPAIESMLNKYPRNGLDEYTNALREVLQELALLGLWRGKFFEHAAFYGGTALRILYGLDRFSEDMDFSLLTPDAGFSLAPYLPAVEKELAAWGFAVQVEEKKKTSRSAIESAFLKADTQSLLMHVEAGPDVLAGLPPGQLVKIKLEVDRDPPPGFDRETKFCLQPIPFSVLAYTPSSLFAGKMHALLCRAWKNRVKGRDWYDLVWYAGRGIELDLRHLEQRMRQSGHYDDDAALDERRFREMLRERIDNLDVEQAKASVSRFLADASSLDLWSPAFFQQVSQQIEIKLN